MLASLRQEEIVKKVNTEGNVKVKELSQHFKVTEDCIRKDLTMLENKGLLKKIHGGAVCLKVNPRMYRSHDRKKVPNDERKRIAQKAVQLIEANDTLYLDVSLTSIEIAQLLLENPIQCTVVTHMIDVLNILSCEEHISLIFIGGQLNNERDAFWGSLSQSMVHQFRIDKSFLGVVGIDIGNNAISTYDIDDGLMKKAIIEQSQKNYLLCEKRKLLEYGNYIYASLDDVQGIITSNIDQEYQVKLLQKNILVI